MGDFLPFVFLLHVQVSCEKKGIPTIILLVYFLRIFISPKFTLGTSIYYIKIGLLNFSSLEDAWIHNYNHLCKKIQLSGCLSILRIHE